MRPRKNSILFLAGILLVFSAQLPARAKPLAKAASAAKHGGNIFVGTLERYSQSFSPTMQGAVPEAEIEFFLTEHPDKGFSVKINKAIQWGILAKENPVSLNFIGKGWKVQFVTTGKPTEVAYNSITGGSGKYDLYNVKAFKKISGSAE
jgi:hypothetical protein